MLTTPAEFDAWLSAELEEALKLQQPLPARQLQIFAKGAKQDATA
jgi:putative SOS response-associated peptidase YedK